MKRALVFCAAAASALSLAACNRNQAGNSAMADTNTTGAANTATPGQSGPVNAAQDVTSTAVGQTSAATAGSVDTGAFVENAARSGLYEIDAANIALKRSKDPDVRAFANMMVTDHTRLDKDMTPVALKANQTPPKDLDQRRKGLLDNLKSASDADFDKTYMDQQVSAHQEALTLMKGYADHGSDAGLKAAAAKAVPVLEKHLDRAKAAQDKVSGSGAGPQPK
jgi:putative membrane protein